MALQSDAQAGLDLTTVALADIKARLAAQNAAPATVPDAMAQQVKDNLDAANAILASLPAPPAP